VTSPGPGGNRRRAAKRLLEILTYILIAIALVSAILIHANYHRGEKAPDMRWVGLAGITLVTFGYPLKWYRRYWLRWPFWATFFCLLALHLTGYVALLRSVEHFGYLWFAIINPLEWIVIRPILEWAGETAERGWVERVERDSLK
jgi:hypothetical protein